MSTINIFLTLGTIIFLFHLACDSKSSYAELCRIKVNYPPE